MSDLINQINTTRGYFNDSSFGKLLARIFINKYLFIVNFVFAWLENIFGFLILNPGYIVFSFTNVYWLYLFAVKNTKVDLLLLSTVILFTCPLFSGVNFYLMSIIVSFIIYIWVVIKTRNKWLLLISFAILIEIFVKQVK